MKHQKENKTKQKNSLSTNVPVCYKIITLQNHSIFFFFFLKNKTYGVYTYNKLELGGGGGKNMWVSKHSRNDLDQGEQDFGLQTR